MKFAFVNWYNKNPGEEVITGISAIGQSLCYGGNEVVYISRNRVKEDIEPLRREECDVLVLGLADIPTCLNIIETCGIGRIAVFADGVYGQMEYRTYADRVLYAKILDRADVVIVNSDASEMYIREWVGGNTRKVLNIGFPVNIRLVERAYSTNDIPQEPRTVWQGYFDMRVHHDTTLCCKMFHDMAWKSLVVGIGEYNGAAKTMFRNMGMDSIEVLNAISPVEFLSTSFKRCSLSLYFPVRPSLGRSAAECAVVGIPSIGTESFFQKEFFPELTMSRIDPDRIRELVRGLDSDPKFKRDVLAYAREKVEQYEPERFSQLLVPAMTGRVQ